MDWKIKRGNTEFAAPDAETLKAWAREGRVAASDYVFNPVLNRWMYASEVAELAGQFRAKSSDRQASRSSCGLAVALFLFSVMLGLLGMGEGIGIILGAGAILFALLAGILYVMGK